jgi:chromosome segregation ATPase
VSKPDNILAPIAALTLPDSSSLTARAQATLDFIESLPIVNAEDYNLAADELKAIKAKANKLEEQRTAITGPMNAALRGVNALFKAPGELLEKAERILKTKMLDWDREQERIAAEARRKAEMEAAAERKRLEAEAAERQRVADAEAAAAAAAAAKGDEQAAQLAQANAERAAAEAQTAAFEAQVVIAAPIATVRAAATGISTAKKIDFEVTDTLALIKHVAEHPELASLVTVDSVRLRAYVKGLGLACKLPGVRVFEDRVMSARAA